MLTVIITMAGLGNRFKKAGYTVPKYEIVAKGKTLFEWSLDSLKDLERYVDKIIFIVRKEDNAKEFITDKCCMYGYNHVEILEIDHSTDGQATTAMLAMDYCACDTPIFIYNIDTYIEPYELKYEYLKGDGHIPCFHSEGTHWSFVKTDNVGRVTEVREKKRISNNCSVGAYYFSSAKLYKKIYEEYYKNVMKLECNEKYIAPLYNYMIERGLLVTMSIVDAEKVHVLGTPEELKSFKILS